VKRPGRMPKIGQNKLKKKLGKLKILQDRLKKKDSN
jgi:hypothetical protein